MSSPPISPLTSLPSVISTLEPPLTTEPVSPTQTSVPNIGGDKEN